MKSLVFFHFKILWSTFIFVDFIHRKHLTGRVVTSDWIPLQISDSVADQFEYCPLSTETYPTRRSQGRGHMDTILRKNGLNTAHFCILCVLNILCHISCWGSTWKFHVLMLDCGRIWHLWQDVAGATCLASTCCCLQSDRKPGLNYVTEWPTLVFLSN